jgi:hypothetical protein
MEARRVQRLFDGVGRCGPGPVGIEIVNAEEPETAAGAGFQKSGECGEKRS